MTAQAESLASNLRDLGRTRSPSALISTIPNPRNHNVAAPLRLSFNIEPGRTPDPDSQRHPRSMRSRSTLRDNLIHRHGGDELVPGVGFRLGHGGIGGISYRFVFNSSWITSIALFNCWSSP
jgi:hypothetical protein